MKIDIYSTENQLIDSVDGFVSGAVKAGETANFIVSYEHVYAMRDKMMLVFYDNTFGLLSFESSFIDNTAVKKRRAIPLPTGQAFERTAKKKRG